MVIPFGDPRSIHRVPSQMDANTLLVIAPLTVVAVLDAWTSASTRPLFEVLISFPSHAVMTSAQQSRGMIFIRPPLPECRRSHTTVPRNVQRVLAPRFRGYTKHYR